MSADANRRMVSSIYDALAREDTAPLLAALSDDVEWSNLEDNPICGTYRGRDGVVEFFAGLDRTELRRFDIETLLADERRVVAVIDVAYLVKSTGKVWEGPAVHVWDLEGGEVKRFLELAATSGEAWTA